MILIFLAIMLTLLTDGMFITPRNLTNLTRQVSINGILACGMTLVILISQIDLSIGSIVALSGIIVGISQVNWGWGEWGMLGAIFSTLLAIAIGILCGLFNGYWTAKQRIASFITTLGMMVIARGLAFIFSNGVAIAPISPELQAIGNGYIPPIISLILISGILLIWSCRTVVRQRSGQIEITTIITLPALLILGYIFFSYRGIPIPVLLLAAVTLVSHFVLNRMTVGRYIFALGGNAEAARLSGVPIQKVTFFVFLIMGGLSGLGGLLLTSRLNGAIPTAGNLFELDAIAAVVIGGTSLMGGVGTIIGSLSGAFVIGILNNGMSLMNIPTFYQMVIKGLIIILAVFFDSRSKKGSLA